MSTWNDGIKEVCRGLSEKEARELELEWMNDYTNIEKQQAAVKAWEKVEKYK